MIWDGSRRTVLHSAQRVLVLKRAADFQEPVPFGDESLLRKGQFPFAGKDQERVRTTSLIKQRLARKDCKNLQANLPARRFSLANNQQWGCLPIRSFAFLVGSFEYCVVYCSKDRKSIDGDYYDPQFRVCLKNFAFC